MGVAPNGSGAKSIWKGEQSMLQLAKTNQLGFPEHVSHLPLSVCVYKQLCIPAHPCLFEEFHAQSLTLKSKLIPPNVSGDFAGPKELVLHYRGSPIVGLGYERDP